VRAVHSSDGRDLAVGGAVQGQLRPGKARAEAQTELRSARALKRGTRTRRVAARSLLQLASSTVLLVLCNLNSHGDSESDCHWQFKADSSHCHWHILLAGLA
jgi:hypothetical protein